MACKLLVRKFQSLRVILEEKITVNRERVAKLRRESGETEIDQITADQIVKGMRGMRALVNETSTLDPYSGIKFRGLTIPDCQERLPKKHNQPLPESVYWLLLTGDIPTPTQTEELRSELASRAFLPQHIEDMLNSLPKTLHPMVQLSIGVNSLCDGNQFDKAFKSDCKRADYWKSALEDALNLVAKIPRIAAIIYRNTFKDGKICAPSQSCDLAENLGRMLGWDDQDFFELLRLYLTLHCDHEGGNVSAHTTHLVGSGLCDVFRSYSSGLNALAGPLHGLANQEVLKWLIELWKIVGDSPTENDIRKYVEGTMKKGQVVPGYGHAVLRVPDPRFLIELEYKKNYIQNDPLLNIVELCYKVIPDMLKQQGKAKNPYPNVDAGSGALLHHYGLREYEFFTVLFGVSRAIGCSASQVWDRALLLPIERPISLTLENLQELVQQAKS